MGTVANKTLQIILKASMNVVSIEANSSIDKNSNDSINLALMWDLV